jgi:hypothetical protein
LTFFPLCLLAGESKVNSLYSSIKPGRSSTPYLSLTSREANLSAKTYSFLDVGHQGTWRTKASTYSETCILLLTSELLDSSLNFKKKIFSFQKWNDRDWRVDSPCPSFHLIK